MKTNRIMDEIRSTISPEMKMQMELSVAIANRIYDILEAKGLSQRDFARLMGKSENEVSRWLFGISSFSEQRCHIERQIHHSIHLFYIA